MDLSEQIRTYRQRRGLSQEALAERMGVSRQAVTKWEAGKARPSTEKLLQLSQVLEVPLEQLAGGQKVPASRSAGVPRALPWVLLGLTLLLGLCTGAALLACHPVPEGVIGYADGPTGIYVTGTPTLPIVLGILTALLVLATLVAFLLRRRGGQIVRRFFCLGLALLAALVLTGCGQSATQPQQETLPAAIEAWPDNAFTAGLPEPQGTPDYVIDDSAQGRFSVFYQDVDRSAWQDWLQQLEQVGFSRRAEASEAESENYLLTGPDRALSVSRSGETLAVTITMEQN